MICITSDIHHMSLKTGNQAHSDLSEAAIACQFVERLHSNRAQITCFITGKLFEEEWSAIKPVCDSENVEIGGHTYYCFMPELWHRGCNKILGSYNGPKWQQNWDIAKTKRIIKNKTGRSISSWRNHMYMHGPHTEELLLRNGIEVCCDGVKGAATGFELHENGVLNFPLNIIPDHEHLYHAERTEKWVKQWVARYQWSDDYGSQSYYLNDWLEIFKHGILEREQQGIVSHLLIHPITIYLCGGFDALYHVADFLSQFETTTVTRLARTYYQKKQLTQSNTSQIAPIKKER